MESRLLLTIGNLDPAFGVAGLQASDFTDANGFLEEATAIEVDSQGGIVVAGTSLLGNGLLLRYNSAGQLDSTFGVDGRLLVGLFPAGITGIAIQETAGGAFNGVLAVGAVVSGGDQDFGVLYIDAQGNIASGWGDNGSGLVTIDFDPGNSQANIPRGIVRTGNDVYVVGDTKDVANNDSEFAVARITADTGNVVQFRTVSFDAHARVNGNFDDIAYDVAVDANNRVVLAGTVFANAAGADRDFAVVRLNQDLTDDNTFGQEVFDFGGNSDDRAFSVAVEGTGSNISVYLGGVSDASDATLEDFAIAKLMNNGDRDTSFGGNDGLVKQDMRIRAANATNDRIGEIAILGGTLVAGGQARELPAVFNAQVDFALGRFDKSTGNRTGLTHTSFFAYREDAANAMAISGTDILLAGGTGFFTSGQQPEFNTSFLTNVAVARYDSTGQLRTAANGPEFGNEGRVVSSVAEFGVTTDSALAVEARTTDGKIVAGGFTEFSEIFSGAVTVYNADGTLDPSFGIGGRVAVGLFNIAGITDLTVLKDDAGNFDGVLVTGPIQDGGDQDFGVLNLTKSGNIRTGWGDNGSGMVSVDFDPGNSQSSTPRAIVQNGNDVYVVGDTRDFANQDSEFAIVRLNRTTGGLIGSPRIVSFDTHASLNGQFDDVAYDAAVDSNNRITIVGTAFAGAAGSGQDFSVTRLNQDLTDDNSFGKEVFDFGGNLSDQAFSVAVEGSGSSISTYIGGFTANGNGGLEDLALAKLLNNGDRDTSFGGGDGLIIQDTRKVASVNSNDRIAEIAILNGNIVAAGQARQPGGTTNRQVDFSLTRFNKGTGASAGTTFTSFFAFNQDAAQALDIDTAGNIVVAGATGVTTQATAANLPLQTRRGNDAARFVDISGSGTALNLGDDVEANINTTVGNALFPAGVVTVGNNGGIMAGGGLNVPTSNFSLPNGSGTALYPFWDDIDSDTGNVFWEERMVDGINTLIVQWDDRPHFSNVGSGTFQVQVPSSGPVLARFAYLDVDFGNAAFDNGASATIGFQVNGAPNQVSFDTPNSVRANDFIEFVGGDAFGIGGESAAVSTSFALARYNSSGGLQTSGFGNDGLVVTGLTALSGSDDEARAVEVARDGRIVVAGGTVSLSAQGAVAVYLPNGTLDPAFGVGGRLPIGLFDQFFAPDGEFGITDLVVLEDGSGNFDGAIVTGPVFNPVTGEVNFAAMKLTAAGEIATGWGDDGSGTVSIDFDPGNNQGATPRALALRGNDLYIAGDSVDFNNGDTEFAVVRINALTGSVVGTPRVVPFDITTGGQNDDIAFDVAVDSLGRVLLAGSTRTGDEDFAIVRLQANLTDDNTFGQEVFDFAGNNQDRATSLVISETANISDYRIYVGGFTSGGPSTTQDFGLAKLRSNGDRDTSFGVNGLVIDDFRRTASVTSDDLAAEIQLQDGHIVVAGTSFSPAGANSTRSDYATGRFTTASGARDNTLGGDGTVHTSFFASPFAVTQGLAITPTDGAWIQIGRTGAINDNFGLARLQGPNAAPVVGGLAAVTYTEGDGGKPIAAAGTVADSDNDNIQRMTITLTNPADGESITVTPSDGIVLDAASTATNLILTGSTIAANYQKVLRTLAFTNPSESPTDAPDRTVNVTVRDSKSADSTLQTITIDVTPVADKPVVDLNGPETGVNFTSSYTPGNPAAVIVDTDATVTDSDTPNLISATITLGSPSVTESLSITGAPAGITAAAYNAATGVLSLSGNASLADYQTAIRLLKYADTNTAATGNKSVSIVVNDGTANSDPATATIIRGAAPLSGDMDGDGQVTTQDGNLVTLILLGASDSTLELLKTPGSTATAAQMRASFESNKAKLDVDKNGSTQSQDGNLIVLVKLGASDSILELLRGPANTPDTRNNATQIKTFVQNLGAAPAPEFASTSGFAAAVAYTPVSSAKASVPIGSTSLDLFPSGSTEDTIVMIEAEEDLDVSVQESIDTSSAVDSSLLVISMDGFSDNSNDDSDVFFESLYDDNLLLQAL